MRKTFLPRNALGGLTARLRVLARQLLPQHEGMDSEASELDAEGNTSLQELVGDGLFNEAVPENGMPGLH